MISILMKSILALIHQLLSQYDVLFINSLLIDLEYYQNQEAIPVSASPEVIDHIELSAVLTFM